MNIEQRLYRAAHELRELPIETPRLGEPPRRRFRPATLVAPVLFALGGAVAVSGALTGPTGDSDLPSAAALTTVPTDTPVVVLTPAEELQIIAALGRARAPQPDEAPEATPRPATAAGPRTVR